MNLKLSIILFLLFLSHFAFGQGPVCRYRIALEQVDTIKYEYRFFIEDQDFGKIDLEYYVQDFSLLEIPNDSELVQIGNRNKLILTQLFSRPCSSIQEKGLRAIIGRKNKKTDEIELMYTETSIEESYTEIIFKKFKVGKQKAKLNRTHSFFKTHSYEN